ncbi:uncharacterized protein CCOS01_02669, partial [Colletotrichum costaricense]
NLSRPPHHPPLCPCLRRSLVRCILWLGSPGRRRRSKLVCRPHPVFAHVETLDRRWRLSKEKRISTTTHLVTKENRDCRQGKEPPLQLVPWAVSVGTSCALARRPEPTEYLSHNLCYLYLPITKRYSCQHRCPRTPFRPPC